MICVNDTRELTHEEIEQVSGGPIIVLVAIPPAVKLAAGFVAGAAAMAGGLYIAENGVDKKK